MLYILEPEPLEECPAVPETVTDNPKRCSVLCRSHLDCELGICCFNGCGTACKNITLKNINKIEDRVSSMLTNKGNFSNLF